MPATYLRRTPPAQRGKAGRASTRSLRAQRSNLQLCLRQPWGLLRCARNDSVDRHEAGQSLVEMALGLAVLILLILGIVDFSRMAFTRNALTSAAREGARYATVHPDAGAGEISAAAKHLLGGLDTDAVNVTLSLPDADHVQVEVTYTFHPTSPWIGWFVDRGSGAGVVLTGRSLMWKERS